MSTEDPLRNHSFDGIQEYDNKLPRWWLATFWITALFGLGYWLYYSVWHEGPNQAQEFSQAMRAIEDATWKTKVAHASAAADHFDAVRLTAIRADATAMQRGKATYEKNCTSCHGARGEGGIGPNLTDTAWLHGGKPEQIFLLITNGVPEKGMLTWKGILTAEQILEVTAHTLTLQGTNPPNAKAPQGTAE